MSTAIKLASIEVNPITEQNNISNKVKIEPVYQLLEDCEILIIEDEIISSALIERYLKDIKKNQSHLGLPQEVNNYKIKTLNNGWELLRRDLSNVKVAIIDILLPQITGVDLIKDFRERYPNMGIIPVSGMATEPMKRKLNNVLPEGFNLIDKPLRKESFYSAFSKAIDFNQQPQPAQKVSLVVHEEEPGEKLWTEVHSNPNIKIPTLKRKKLVNKRSKEKDIED